MFTCCSHAEGVAIGSPCWRVSLVGPREVRCAPACRPACAKAIFLGQKRRRRRKSLLARRTPWQTLQLGARLVDSAVAGEAARRREARRPVGPAYRCHGARRSIFCSRRQWGGSASWATRDVSFCGIREGNEVHPAAALRCPRRAAVELPGVRGNLERRTTNEGGRPGARRPQETSQQRWRSGGALLFCIAPVPIPARLDQPIGLRTRARFVAPAAACKVGQRPRLVSAWERRCRPSLQARRLGSESALGSARCAPMSCAQAWLVHLFR